jgi:hypothetical protein
MRRWIEFSHFTFFDDLEHIYLNFPQVNDFSYIDFPLDRYLIRFSYLKYGTGFFNEDDVTARKLQGRLRDVLYSRI